ncbi:serine hydrolase domain-containing protein [Stenotrophomonas sp. TWI1149]|uniref:serine hydrolase domain-containing protein n=1 Tax=unclassified Stenotrophomonas TaxID=196198 RepID=UPI003207EE05
MLALLTLVVGQAAASLPEPPAAPPGLPVVDAFLHESTGPQGYTGAVVLVIHDGSIVHDAAYGWQDLAHARPMRTDSIFRLYSMTKTVASVAAMMLVEEGRLDLDDPVARHLPEFSHLQVFAGGTAAAPQLRPATQTLTVLHLLTHTAGFAAGGEGFEAVTALLERQQVQAADSLADYTARLARAPLATEPGTRFRYDSTSIEVLSRLVEVVGGLPFEQFLQQRIFRPLAMADTGFVVPARDRARVVELTTMGEHGDLVLADEVHAREPGSPLRPYPSGAGGLYSTAGDYGRFAQMLLDGGRHGDTHLLRPATVALMMQNQLVHTALPRPVTEFSDAEGFGLGGSVLLDPAMKGRTASVGAFGWSGAASTYYTIDPARRLVAILLLQHLPGGNDDLPRISTMFYNRVDEALDP